MTQNPFPRVVGAVLTVLSATPILTTSSHVSAAPQATATAQTRSQTGAGLEPLFTPVAQPARTPGSDLAKDVRRSATVTVSERAIASGAILTAEAHLLNLFPDVRVLAVRSRVESRSAQDYSWFGYIPGDEFGRVIISVLGGRLGVDVSSRGKHYVVLPRSNGVHDVLDIDDDSYPDCPGPDRSQPDPVDAGHPPVTSRAVRAKAGLALDIDGSLRTLNWSLGTAFEVPDDLIAQDDGSVIDVLVLYTHNAATYTEEAPHSHTEPDWNMLFRAQHAIARANQSFEDSGIHTRLKMVPWLAREQYFVETGDIDTDLAAMKQDVPIARLQFEYAADIVVLITDGLGKTKDEYGGCGLTNAHKGFSVVKASCLGLTVAHEVGHILGAQHDWYEQVSDEDFIPPPSWSDARHGYVQIASWDTAVRTIMAEIGYCRHLGISCPRIGRWSSPYDFTQNNLPLGIPKGLPYPANDAQQLNDNVLRVARFFRSGCRIALGC